MTAGRDGEPPAPAAPASAADLGKRHVRGSALFTLGRVLSLLFTVSTQVAIVRYLPVDEFGAFAYALVIVSTGRLLLSLGQGSVLSRFLSLYEEQGDRARMVGSLLLGAMTVAVTGTALLIAALLFVDELATSGLEGGTELSALLLVLILLAPLEALDELFIAVFASMTKARSIFVRRYLLVPGLRLLVVLLMIVTSQDAVFLAVGYVAVQGFGLLLYGVLLVRLLRARGLLGYLRPHRVVLPVRAVLALAVPSLTGTLVYLSMNFGSVVLLSLYWGAAEIALYRAVFPAARLNQFVYTAFSTLYLPMAARLFARDDVDGARTAYWQTAVLLLVGSFPVFAMTSVFAPLTTVVLFGERYAESAAVLLLLSLGYYLNVALGFNANTLVVFGRGRRLLAVNGTAAAANLALCAVLVREHGAVGVAVANAVTLLLQNALYQGSLMATLRTGFVDRAHLRPYVMVALATAALWGFRAAADPSFPVAVVAVAVVSLVLVRLTRRELRLGDTFPELRRVPGVRLLVA
ncbi:MAG: hypothetical protein ACLGIG_03430 [Actinomycetes bacterium]